MGKRHGVEEMVKACGLHAVGHGFDPDFCHIFFSTINTTNPTFGRCHMAAHGLVTWHSSIGSKIHQ